MSKEQSKEIVKLGRDEVFALKDKSGEIRAFEHELTLSAANGGLIQIPTAKSQPWVISAQGYEMWAEDSGASVIMPREVVVDGEIRGNPCIVADRENRIISATARAIAFRFSSKGIPQVSDWTTILDLDHYRMVDLLAKAKKFPQAFKLLPMEMKPDEDGTWAKYHFDSSTALWINTTHKEALTWYSQIRQREKKIIDYAQTFAKRNALKHLSGLQKSPTGPTWVMRVLCWRPLNDSVIKWDSTQYKMLQDRVQDLTDGNGGVEKTAGTENAIEDENFDVLLQDTDPEDSPADIQTEPEPKTIQEVTQEVTQEEPEQELTEGQIMKNNLLIAQKEFPEIFKNACAANKVKPETLEKADPNTMNLEICKKIQAEINRELDQNA